GLGRRPRLTWPGPVSWTVRTGAPLPLPHRLLARLPHHGRKVASAEPRAAETVELDEPEPPGRLADVGHEDGVGAAAGFGEHGHGEGPAFFGTGRVDRPTAMDRVLAAGNDPISNDDEPPFSIDGPGRGDDHQGLRVVSGRGQGVRERVLVDPAPHEELVTA